MPSTSPRSHSTAPGFILVKEQMRETAGPRSDHRGQEEPARSEHAHHREERRLPVRDVVEGRHHADGVEGTVAEWQLSRISDPDVDAFPGKYVGAEAASVGAGEVVVSAGKVEEAPADKRQHHAESPRLEKVHPAPRGFVLRPLRLQLDEGLRLVSATVMPDSSLSTAQGTTAQVRPAHRLVSSAIPPTIRGSASRTPAASWELREMSLANGVRLELGP